MKAVLVVGALLAAACSPSSSGEVTTAEAGSADAADINLVMTNEDFVDDRMVEMPAGGSVEGRETLNIDADDLSAAVESNEFAAEKQYGDRNLIVAARIKAVTSQSDTGWDYGRVALKIDTSNHESMEANLFYSEDEKALEMRAGDDVRLQCQGYEYNYYKVALNKCTVMK